MKVREARATDFDSLMGLYAQLHGDKIPEKTEKVRRLWGGILLDRNHHIIVAEEDGAVLSSCVCVVVPNLTHGGRPYALVENVVTDGNHRRKGLATACLEYARKIARGLGCYKIMLMTGSKQESTLNFYRNAGYNDRDKTAFIQWLD